MKQSCIKHLVHVIRIRVCNFSRTCWYLLVEIKKPSKVMNILKASHACIITLTLNTHCFIVLVHLLQCSKEVVLTNRLKYGFVWHCIGSLWIGVLVILRSPLYYRFHFPIGFKIF